MSKAVFLLDHGLLTFSSIRWGR
uniref:Uncharacterized protein n=1 Tax=Anguilla anguilla TaxID=7936 RepID=A0A0E9UXV3_ANGAN